MNVVFHEYGRYLSYNSKKRYYFSKNLQLNYQEGFYMNTTKLLNETLQSLGISKCYKGYRQLHLSVELALDDESRLECITDCIYNQVADMCNCDCRHIERNIRTVANHAWEVNAKRLTEIAGYTLISSPSVSELISILVTYIERNRLENK